MFRFIVLLSVFLLHSVSSAPVQEAADPDVAFAGKIRSACAAIPVM